MLKQVDIEKLKAQNDRILAYNKENLISKNIWGEISFEDYRIDFDRIYWFANQLKIYSVESLPSDVFNSFLSCITNIANHFDTIDKFRLSTSSTPQSQRNQYAHTLHELTETLYKSCVIWIPFLAHQRGDVEENIRKLTESVSDANGIVENTKNNIKGQEEEIQKIITSAREASAGAGAAVFTKDFEAESEKKNKLAKKWLGTTIAMAIITIIVASTFWYTSEAIPENSLFIQKLTSKIFVLAILFTGTLWCARNYKALRHLAIINKHRSNSILTIQAFANAAHDLHTKDAVLLEASKAIFGTVPTGFVNSNIDSDLKFVEVARNIIPKSE